MLPMFSNKQVFRMTSPEPKKSYEVYSSPVRAPKLNSQISLRVSPPKRLNTAKMSKNSPAQRKMRQENTGTSSK